MSNTIVTVLPTDPKAGLTLQELAEFVSTSYAHGATGEDRIRIIAGYRSQIKKIWTTPTTKVTP